MNIRRNILVGGLAVLAVAALVFGIYYAWLITPPGLPATAAEGLATLASARYERLPDYRKQEYAARTRELIEQMPDDQRHEMFQKMRGDQDARHSMREVFRQSMDERLRKLATADDAERDQLLDEMIDRMQEQRAARANRPRPERPAGQTQDSSRSDGDRRRDGDRRGNFRDRMQKHIEEGNPQHHAIRREMHQAIRERMEERGIDPPSHGPGRPGS
jgi:hypothetical protein